MQTIYEFDYIELYLMQNKARLWRNSKQQEYFLVSERLRLIHDTTYVVLFSEIVSKNYWNLFKIIWAIFKYSIYKKVKCIEIFYHFQMITHFNIS
jgi:hypothetical protein